MTITHHAFPLVETMEPVQVRFKLRLRDQQSMMDVKSTWVLTWHRMHHVHDHLDYFQKPLLGYRPNTKPLGDHGTPNAHNCRLILFYHVWRPAWIYIFIGIVFGWGPSHIWLHTTLEGPNHTTWVWGCVGTAFGHFLLGSHNLMVTALGSCVKWPLISRKNQPFETHIH